MVFIGNYSEMISIGYDVGVKRSFAPGMDCRSLGLRAKIKSAEHTPAL